MIKAITGTKDVLPSEVYIWQNLEKKLRDIFDLYNFKEIRTPIFEETQLFARGIGEETDIVGKEMYTFNDRSGTSLTLKPEMTASVVRAFIEHSMDKHSMVHKLYYISSMFRQERPQAGRLRQFNQFGCEVLGTKSPLADTELIIIAYSVLNNLGLSDISVKLNSLGTTDSREKFKQVLSDYLSDKINYMSEDSKKRFEKNILRIFDSKAQEDIDVMKDAPSILDFLDNESKEDFEIVKAALSKANIPFVIDNKLVRGLDYYSKTTFEIISNKVGSQSALCGGGRYDLLVKQLGGADIPGVGFAAGMERILLACQNENVFKVEPDPLRIYVILLEADLKEIAFSFLNELRNKGISCDMDFAGRSVKAQMREANRQNADFACFIGGDEFKQNKIVVKNLKDGSQKILDLSTDEIIMDK